MVGEPPEIEMSDPLEAAMLHFGFQPITGSSTTSSPPLTEREKLLLRCVLGLRKLDPKFLDMPVSRDIYTFVSSLRPGSGPVNHSWDLALGSPYPVVHLPLMSYIDKVSDDLYLVRLPNPVVHWTLAVHTPSDVLFLVRLCEEQDEYGLARRLLLCGIRFLTLVPLPAGIPRLPSPLVPMRVDHEFTKDDFNAYERRRAHMLEDRRIARACLMAGGILWRLAMQTLGFDVVLEGPTTAATLHQQGVMLSVGDGAMWDDGLSETEANLICGLFRFKSGDIIDGHISYWPQHALWVQHSPYGRWCDELEAWFLGVLAKYQSGEGKPRMGRVWKQWIRPSKDIRGAIKYYRDSARSAVDNNIHGSSS